MTRLKVNEAWYVALFASALQPSDSPTTDVVAEAIRLRPAVKTASGATAVQIVHSSRRGSRDIEHLGSAHDEAELEALKAAARQRLVRGQGEFDLGLGSAGGSAPLEITSSRVGHLWDGLCRAYDVLGLDEATGGDEVFRDLVLARVIEPTSKLDCLRVLAEVGIDPVSYRTITRRLPAYAKESWRRRLAATFAQHAALGPASLVLYDVSTLYFETDAADGFREPGFWQGTPAGAADHDRVAHRRLRVPVDGRGVRGQQGRDHNHAPDHHLVHGRPPPRSCDRGGGCGDGVGGEQ